MLSRAMSSRRQCAKYFDASLVVVAAVFMAAILVVVVAAAAAAASAAVVIAEVGRYGSGSVRFVWGSAAWWW